MDVKEVEKGIENGALSVKQLLQLFAESRRQLDAAMRRIEELERQLGGPTKKLDQSYSLEAEERRRQAKQARKERRRRNKRLQRGRMKTAEKVARAVRTERCFPEGVPAEACFLSHTRAVWRLELGRAVLVAYEIWRGPGNRYGRIPGVLGRSEFGVEIMLSIAYQVYVVGLSFDKVCQLSQFFQDLQLRKSQVDALLYQLSREWEKQFDLLCALVSHSAVVHADETGWSINSVWTLLGEKARLLLFGVHKDSATLGQILDPATFQGLLITDDAAVYGTFNHTQKCWAHLLRKAIKLTLLEPQNAEYRQFTDRLLAIYREACRVRRDGRLSDAGRARKVVEMDDQIVELCLPMWAAELPKLEGVADDYRLLVNEVMRLMLDRELFAFVTSPDVTLPNGEQKPVSGTNNEAERTLRGPALARVTGRTNKTTRGARRQTVIASVLESLRCYLKSYTLSSVIVEVQRWIVDQRSCFQQLVRRLKITPHETSADRLSVLDTLLPQPSD